MRQQHDRRRFLQVGLGCAAPLLLTTPVVQAARSLARQVPPVASDPVLDFLRSEARRNYRRIRAAAETRRQVAGEEYRATASHLALIQAYLQDKGQDARFDQDLRRRIRREGRDATALAVSESYRQWREASGALADLAPKALDFATAGDAVDVLHKKGVRWATGVLRLWTLDQGRRADHVEGVAVPVPVALRQKPGDDFLGFGESGDWQAVNCGNVGNIINAWWVVVAFIAVVGAAPLAEACGFVVAALQYYAGMACTQ
jgi:hypothetical protein